MDKTEERKKKKLFGVEEKVFSEFLEYLIFELFFIVKV